MLRRLLHAPQLAALRGCAATVPRSVSTLAFEELRANAATPPARTAYLLHGLLGQGRNWRTFAKRLLDAAAEAGAADWRLVLVDLRNHGQTALRGHFAPPGPHSVGAAAEDVRHLAAQLGAPQLVLGHSMGGKVALAYGALAGAHASPLSIWALDSIPGPTAGDPHAVGAVLDAVAALPAVVPSRDWMAQELRGKVPAATAAWLASSLVPLPGSPATGPLRFAFNLQGARQMFDSYRGLDLWPVFESPPPGVDAHLVRAGRSAAWSGAVADRIAGLPPAAATRLHLLPDASHWLHVDKPAELVQLLLPALTQR